jgi:hypothetical protein
MHDRDEVEIVVQAPQLDATVIVDDARGRQLALLRKLSGYSQEGAHHDGFRPDATI